MEITDIIEVIEAAELSWFAKHPECRVETTDDTDEEINEALGLLRTGAIRDLDVELDGWTAEQITAAVHTGLDSWWDRADVRFDLITEGATPAASVYKPATRAELEELRREIIREWSEYDIECLDGAISAMERGDQVLVATDQDGYWFATAKRVRL